MNDIILYLPDNANPKLLKAQVIKEKTNYLRPNETTLNRYSIESYFYHEELKIYYDNKLIFSMPNKISLLKDYISLTDTYIQFNANGNNLIINLPHKIEPVTELKIEMFLDKFDE